MLNNVPSRAHCALCTLCICAIVHNAHCALCTLSGRAHSAAAAQLCCCSVPLPMPLLVLLLCPVPQPRHPGGTTRRSVWSVQRITGWTVPVARPRLTDGATAPSSSTYRARGGQPLSSCGGEAGSLGPSHLRIVYVCCMDYGLAVACASVLDPPFGRSLGGWNVCGNFKTTSC